MTEVTSTLAGTPAGETPSQTAAEAGAALVQFEGDAVADAQQFTDAPPSEWAFAAHEASLTGEAIDTVRDCENNGLLSLAVAATAIMAEADLFAGAPDALVAMAPSVPVYDMGTNGAEDAGATAGMVMWTGQEGDSHGAPDAAFADARSDAPLMPHEITSHGISLDWTDTLLSYA